MTEYQYITTSKHQNIIEHHLLRSVRGKPRKSRLCSVSFCPAGYYHNILRSWVWKCFWNWECFCPAREEYCNLGFENVSALPFVCIVRLLYSTIVRNILSLGVDPIQVDVDGGPRGVVAVLPDDALRLVQVVLLRWPLPPVGEVPGRVERSALVVEAMSDLVSDNLDFELVYTSSKLLGYIPLFSECCQSSWATT